MNQAAPLLLLLLLLGRPGAGASSWLGGTQRVEGLSDAAREPGAFALRGGGSGAFPPALSSIVVPQLRCDASAAAAAAAATAPRPKLTWLLVARNDGYLSEYNHPVARLAATLGALFRGLSHHVLAEDSEVVLVDWNSEVPLLRDARMRQLVLGMRKLARGVRFKVVVVPPATCRRHVPDPHVHISEVHALNYAIRHHVRGEMVLRIDQDTVVGSAFFRYLSLEKRREWPAVADGKMWWGTRRDTDAQGAKALLESPEQFIAEHGMGVAPDRREDGRGAVGVFGMPLAKWVHAKGYNEHFLFWGHMEIEFVRRMWRLCGGGMLNLAEEEELPVDKYPFYHIYHGPRTTGRKHNDMNAAKQGGNGGGWGMKGQAVPAVLCQGGCCAPAPRQGAPLDAADCTCQKCAKLAP